MSDKTPRMSAERLLRIARVAGPMLAEMGAPNTAAVCDAYVQVVAENDLLRRQLASFNEWSDEPTRQADPITSLTEGRQA